jgi:flagellar protein FliS
MSYATRRPHGGSPIASYASVGLDTEVLSAAPERLITLLFDGARAAIGQARIHLEDGRTAARGQAISKAIRIVGEGLQQGLNMDAGGEIAANLDRLYDYIVRQLLHANINADVQALNTADQLLADLQSAWKISVDPQPDTSANH